MTLNDRLTEIKETGAGGQLVFLRRMAYDNAGRMTSSYQLPDRPTLADVSACQMTRYPPGLISALEKLQADSTVTHSASTATAHLWIEQPMSGVGDGGRLGGPHRWFDTHRPLDERIALLREL